MKKDTLDPQTLSNEYLYRDKVTAILNSYSGVLVDLGSGEGDDAKRLLATGVYQRAICLDHDVTALAKAGYGGCESVFADLNARLPLVNNMCDVVLCNQVIEHIARTDSLMSEIQRILKSGGRAIFSTPNLASWHNIGALVMGWQPFSMQVSDAVFIGNPKHPHNEYPIEEAQAHLRVFTHRSLVELAGYHKLKLVGIYGVGYYPYLHRNVSSILARLHMRHSAYIVMVVQK